MVPPFSSGTRGSPMPKVKLCSGRLRMSFRVLNAAGKGIGRIAGVRERALYVRTWSGENRVMVTGWLFQTRFSPRLCSQSTPNRVRCAPRCKVTESLSWKRLPRPRMVWDCPTVRPACGMLIVGEPIPRHPAQSCCCAGSVLELTKKYEKRRSFTSVGRNTLVSPKRLWSAQAEVRNQLDGYAFTCVRPGPKARLPSCE